MIFRTNRYQDRYGGEKLFLWHSTIDKVVDSVISAEDREKFLLETTKSGVQLNPLEAALRKYEGYFCVRRLKMSKTDRHSLKSIEEDLLKWMKAEEPKKYEKDYITMLKATMVENQDLVYDDTRYYFCSELVCCTLKHMGLLFFLNTSGYTPQHFSSEYDIVNSLLKNRWKGRITYEKEIQITF